MAMMIAQAVQNRETVLMTAVIAKSLKILRKLTATTRKCIRILNIYVNCWRTPHSLKIEPFRLQDLHILNEIKMKKTGTKYCQPLRSCVCVCAVWCVLCVWINTLPCTIWYSAISRRSWSYSTYDAPSYAFHIRYPMSKYSVFGLLYVFIPG